MGLISGLSNTSNIVESATGTDLIGSLTGETAANAALEAARIQQGGVSEGIAETRAAREQGLGFLEPFQGVGQSAIDQQGFLTDPNQQFEFLQNNPLFKLALENANTQTQQSAAASGRLSAGDTLSQLSNNVLLSASPLIDKQSRNIQNMLALGSNVAGNQANIATGAGANITDLITSGTSAEGAGVVGAANARAQGAQNLLTAGAAFFSDTRLKSNIHRTGSRKGFNLYSWTWNKLAETLGLYGESHGVLAQEVRKVRPDAVIEDRGFLKVNYSMIGVK